LVNFMKNTIRPQLPGELGWSYYGGSILGTYSNITLNNVFRDCFRATDNINLSLDGFRVKSVNLHVEQTIGSLMKSNNGSIYGTYKNIKIDSLVTEDDNALHFFYASGDINGSFENIYCEKNKAIGVFYSDTIYGIFKNIVFQYGIKNESNLTNSFFYATNSIDGIYENIFINSEALNFFVSQGTISGTYSHIKNNSMGVVDSVFWGDVSGYFYDIEFYGGTIERIFQYFATPIEIDRARILTNNYTTSPFNGRMRNTIIYGQRNGNAIYLDEGAVIERCKFLTGANPAIVANSAINAQISYTIIDGEISEDITNDLGRDSWNIVNSNID
jgi:hypothetical protein